MAILRTKFESALFSSRFFLFTSFHFPYLYVRINPLPKNVYTHTLALCIVFVDALLL